MTQNLNYEKTIELCRILNMTVDDTFKFIAINEVNKYPDNKLFNNDEVDDFIARFKILKSNIKEFFTKRTDFYKAYSDLSNEYIDVIKFTNKDNEETKISSFLCNMPNINIEKEEDNKKIIMGLKKLKSEIDIDMLKKAYNHIDNKNELSWFITTFMNSL